MFRIPADAIESRPQNRAGVLLEAGPQRVSRKQPIDESKGVDDLIVDRELIVVHDLAHEAEVMRKRLAFCLDESPGIDQQVDPVGFREPADLREEQSP